MKYLKTLLLATTAIFIMACASDPVFERDFFTTEHEIKRAKIGFGLSKYEALYLMMVDRSGKVVKVRLLDYKDRDIEERIAIRFKSKLYQFEFHEAMPEEQDYREFIFPLDIESKVEFR